MPLTLHKRLKHSNPFIPRNPKRLHALRRYRLPNRCQRHLRTQHLHPFAEPALVVATCAAFFLPHLTDDVDEHVVLLLHGPEQIPNVVKARAL